MCGCNRVALLKTGYCIEHHFYEPKVRQEEGGKPCNKEVFSVQPCAFHIGTPLGKGEGRGGGGGGGESILRFVQRAECI